MRRILSLCCLSLLLAGCGSRTVSFRLQTDLKDPVQNGSVLQAAQRVVERRADRLEVTVTDLSVAAQDDGSALLTFIMKEPQATQLSEELLKPFSLKIMLQSANDTGDLFVEEQGWFTATDITEKDIAWAESFTDKNGKGVVELLFTENGLARLNAIRAKNPAGIIGLFVRDVLMSKMKVDGAKTLKTIAIGGIPSPEIAGIFTDDVNVGLHVTFTQP